MENLMLTRRILCFVLICLMMFSVAFALPSEANAQETGMKMVFGDRSIAMPLPKDRLVVRSKYSYFERPVLQVKIVAPPPARMPANPKPRTHQLLLSIYGFS